MTTANTRYTPTGATSQAADLLPRAGDGDPKAWDEIMRRYGKLVSATVRSFRLQDADALDAVQTTWLRLTENAHRVQFPERLGGWLVTTARHECLRIVRQAKPSQDLIETVADTVADPSVGPEQQAIEADTARTLWSLVEELSPRQQTLLRALFTDHPRPYAEVARSAGIPSGAIGPTRARALRQLRDRLTEHGPGRQPGDNDRCLVHTPRAVRGPVTRDTARTAANWVTSRSSCINVVSLRL
jgi:RNA polymerase sigma factor (sigma-70 family)